MPLDRLIQLPMRDRIKAKRLFQDGGTVDLAMLGAVDVARYRDDFVGDTLQTLFQSTASGANSAAAAVTSPTLNNGLVLLDPGDANAGRSDLSMGLHYLGTNNATIWWAFIAPNPLTNCKFELGFTDTLSGTDAGAVNAKATPTWTATDACLVVFDTTDDTNLTFAGVKNNVASTAYDFTTQLVAGTSYYIGIQLKNDTARAWLLDANGSLIESQPPGNTYAAATQTSTILLTPWAFAQNRSGARHSLFLDLLDVYQWRSTTHTVSP